MFDDKPAKRQSGDGMPHSTAAVLAATVLVCCISALVAVVELVCSDYYHALLSGLVAPSWLIFIRTYIWIFTKGYDEYGWRIWK